jgi:hypothetical protein
LLDCAGSQLKIFHCAREPQKLRAILLAS